MDKVSSIFARFEPRHASLELTSNVIGPVLPRASVGSGGVFTRSIPRASSPLTKSFLPPPITKARTTISRPPEAVSPASCATQQTPLDYLIEASLRRMEDVAMSPSSDLHKPREAPVQELTSRSPPQAAAAQVPVCPMDSVTPTQPLRRLPSRTVPSVKTIVGSGEAKPKRKRIRLKTPRRREQCRNNQARYRKKQAEYAKGLELTVEQLKQEISVLEMQHSGLVSSAKTSVWYVVVEYFHIFYNGARSTRQISSGPEAWLQKSEAQQQLAFLQSSMSDDVVVGDQRGVNALLEQWKRYTSYFDDLQFQLDRMTRISEDSIVAASSLNVTISELTFQRVFPNLLARHEGSSQEHKIALLRSKMLGQRLYLPCRLCFEWDETSKRVVRMERTVDFLTPLLQVVETIADATFVLENSLVSQDGTIREK